MPFVQRVFSCLLACLAAAVDHLHTTQHLRSENDDCDWSESFGACKPKFMVLGVQKSGTSSLYVTMVQHPDIVPSNIKEPLYFTNGDADYDNARCDKVQTTFETYLTQYFGKAKDKMKIHGKSAGEWSATYFHCPCCPSALRYFMPQLKLIVSLRQPIQRATSRFVEQHTQFHVVPGTEFDFDTYVTRHLPGLQSCLQDAKDPQAKTVCLGKDNVLGLSVYDAPLQNWLAAYPKNQLLVTYLDQLDHNPAAELNRIETHLGLRHIQYSGLNKEYNHQGNYGWTESFMRVPHKISKLSRDKLLAFYRPSLMNLKQMADEKFIPPLPQQWVTDFNLGQHASLAINDKGAEDEQEQ